jgi:hypothetical protein
MHVWQTGGCELSVIFPCNRNYENLLLFKIHIPLRSFIEDSQSQMKVEEVKDWEFEGTSQLDVCPISVVQNSLYEATIHHCSVPH